MERWSKQFSLLSPFLEMSVNSLGTKMYKYMLKKRFTRPQKCACERDFLGSEEFIISVYGKFIGHSKLDSSGIVHNTLIIFNCLVNR